MGSPENIEANIPHAAPPRGSRSALLLIMFIATIISTGCTFLLYNTEASSLALLVNPFLWPVVPIPFHAFSANNATFFDKPKDIKIFAVVGYRNPARTAILNCYLQVCRPRPLFETENTFIDFKYLLGTEKPR